MIGAYGYPPPRGHYARRRPWWMFWRPMPPPMMRPPMGPLPRLPDTAPAAFFYPPTGPGGEGMYDKGPGPQPGSYYTSSYPTPYPYPVEAEPGFNMLVPL